MVEDVYNCQSHFTSVHNNAIACFCAHSSELLDPLELGSTLLSYTRQVALGMMSLVQKSYVHRDLAARNILVSEDGMTCKVRKYGNERRIKETLRILSV